GEKPVVPFRIENVNPKEALRYYMSSVHWLDALTPPLEQHLQKLAATVRGLVEIQVSQQAAVSGNPKVVQAVETQQGRLPWANKKARTWIALGLSCVGALVLVGLVLWLVLPICKGMPGESAWIYAGEYHPNTSSFQIGPFVKAVQA